MRTEDNPNHVVECESFDSVERHAEQTNTSVADTSYQQVGLNS